MASTLLTSLEEETIKLIKHKRDQTRLENEVATIKENVDEVLKIMTTKSQANHEAMCERLERLQAKLAMVVSELSQIKRLQVESVELYRATGEKSFNIGFYCQGCSTLYKDKSLCEKCEWKCRCGTYNKL